MPSTKSRYRSPLLEAVHSAAEDLYKIGAIDQITMRNFDVECLTPVEPMKPSTIRTLRQKSKMSQATFASALNVTTSLVSQWERGEKKPSGPSLKLLSLVKRKGIDALKIVARQGRYYAPFARVLLAVVSLREGKLADAQAILDGLARAYPHNALFAKELARLNDRIRADGTRRK